MLRSMLLADVVPVLPLAARREAEAHLDSFTVPSQAEAHTSQAEEAHTSDVNSSSS